jgi:hypothetical protein
VGGPAGAPVPGPGGLAAWRGRLRRGSQPDAAARDEALHHAHVSQQAAGLALTTPVALFLLTVWVLHLQRHEAAHWLNTLPPIAAVAIFAAALTPLPVLATGLLSAAMIVVSWAAPAPGAVEPSGSRAPPPRSSQESS